VPYKRARALIALTHACFTILYCLHAVSRDAAADGVVAVVATEVPTPTPTAQQTGKHSREWFRIFCWELHYYSFTKSTHT
jgi:hypothetical protein